MLRPSKQHLCLITCHVVCFPSVTVLIEAACAKGQGWQIWDALGEDDSTRPITGFHLTLDDAFSLRHCKLRFSRWRVRPAGMAQRTSKDMFNEWCDSSFLRNFSCMSLASAMTLLDDYSTEKLKHHLSDLRSPLMIFFLILYDRFAIRALCNL